MKKRILALLLCCGLLFSLASGCKQEQKKLGEEYIKGQDDPYQYLTLFDSKRKIIPADKGYYLMCGAFLFYADEKMQNPVPVCNRPNCRHEQETDPAQVWKCNAYFGGSIRCFNCAAFYDGSLYVYATFDNATLEDRINRIFRVSPDGSQRETVMDFADELSEFYIHRGYLYTLGSLDGKQAVCRYSLSDREHKQEILFQCELAIDQLRSLRLHGNRIYFENSNIKDNKLTTSYYSVDLNTLEISIPFDAPENTSYDVWAILDNQILYTASDFTNGLAEHPEDDNPKNLVLYRCDLNGKNSSVVLQGERIYNVLADENYIYVIDVEYRKDREGKKTENYFTVYSQQGDKLAQYPVEELDKESSIYAIGDENYLYLYKRDGIYKLDKKKIAEGQLDETLIIKTSFEMEYPSTFVDRNNQ